MALRLSAVRQAAEPAASEAPVAPSLDVRAEAALAGYDPDACARLWGQVAEIGDIQRRYRARRDLVEAVLGGADDLPAARVAALLATTARGLIEALEGEPREPVHVNYLGVLLYDLGAFDAAAALFAAAQRMDPTLAHVAANLEQAGRRRRNGVPRPKLPAAVAVALDSLARRAGRLAQRARPARGLTISLCMIVRDEEEMLGRCLASARGAVDEIVVVDTGSLDRTREIARGFGARVIDFAWTGSFAEARNVSLDHATGDWILYLDADEVLVEQDIPELRALTGRTWREAFFLPETSFTGHLEDGMAAQHNALRLFRNRPHYRFEGLLHEQIAHQLPGDLPERVEISTVRIEHYGYLGQVRQSREKSRRNLELLERQVQAEGATPFLHFNLGSEYCALERFGDAARELGESWSELRGQPDRTTRAFLPALLERLVKSLRCVGRLDEALALAEEGLLLLPEHTDLMAEQGLVYRQRGEFELAARCFRRCLEMGDAPARYSPTRGAGSYLALVNLADVRRHQHRPEEAELLLRRCLREHPGFLASVLPLAQVMLAAGATAEHVWAQISGAVRETTATVHFLVGSALYEAGHVRAAADRFRAVLARQPGNRPALVALAEAELSQRAWAAAASSALQVRGDDELGRAARRAELFAALAAEQLDEAAVAEGLARADLDGLAGEHRAVFDAWRAVRAGGAPPALPAGSVALLGTVLEALLRVEELDRFAELMCALHHSALAPRERHELLADLYLRRGFLESAGEQWLTVCQTLGPDERALLGLAQVALAQGARDDAIVFADAVCELAPDHPGALALLAHVAPGQRADGPQGRLGLADH